MTLIRLVIGAVLASAGTAALALQEGGSDTINVIGRKPEEVRKEAENFVRQVAVASRPVARFIDPVCPKALNIPRPIAEKVEARIRAIAEQAGATVARAPCRGNLNITFASNTDGVIDRVVSRSPGMFEDSGPSYAAKIKASAAPIRWWHTTAERTKDGQRPLGNDSPPALGISGSRNVAPLGGQVYQQYRSSFLSSQMVRALVSATIIVDVDRATGLPLDSVASFAALVGLAEIRFDEDAPPNSILSMFAKTSVRDLTPLDTTFLRTLYKLPLDRTAVAHRGLLIRGLVGGDLKKLEHE